MKDFKYIIKRIIIGVAIAIILMLIKGSLVLNVNAATLSSGSGVFGYTIGNYSDTNNHRNANWSGSFPVELLTNAPTNKTLWGVNMTFYLNNVYSGNYMTNSVSTYLTIRQNNAATYFNNSISTVATCKSYNNEQKSANCSLDSTTSNTRTFKCSCSFSNYDYPVEVGMTIGTTNSFTASSPYVSYTGNSNSNSSIFVGGASYDASSTSDPNTGILSDIRDGQDIINGNLENINDTLENDNTSGASTSIAGKLANFHFNTYGLTGIITAPLRFFESLLSATCTPLQFSLPFVHNNVVLPCMSAIYQQYFPTFLFLYRLITNGLIGYWVCIKIFQKVKGFLDPTDDKVEVFDL